MAAVVLCATVLLTVPGTPATAAGGPQVQVVVREVAGAGNAPEALVERLGGTVGRQLRIIGGFAATVPAPAVARLRASRLSSR
jgi:serine protease AprX